MPVSKAVDSVVYTNGNNLLNDDGAPAYDDYYSASDSVNSYGAVDYGGGDPSNVDVTEDPPIPGRQERRRRRRQSGREGEQRTVPDTETEIWYDAGRLSDKNSVGKKRIH